MVSPIDRLARKLSQLETQVKGLSRTPQLAYSSIENGSVDEYDGAGNLAAVIGKQFDGSHGAYPVTGPIPPTPSPPAAEGGISLNIGWDGMFVGLDGRTDATIPAPMDFTRVEVHASRVPGFVADTADTLIDTIESPRGGVRPALLGAGTWFVVLVARSASGKRSAQSAEASAVVRPPVTADEIQELQDTLDGKTTTVTSTEGPSGDAAVGTVWQQEDADHNIIGMWRYEGGTTPWQRVLFGDAMLGDVTASKVTAGITGGGRVRIDETGLHAWGADNVQYLRANASGLSLTGEIEVQGKTSGTNPRPLYSRLTSVQRTYGGNQTFIPGLVFATEDAVMKSAPGVYSPDGSTLRLQGADFLDIYHLDIGSGSGSMDLVHPKINIGQYDTASTLTQAVSIMASTVTIGYPKDSFLPNVYSTVNLSGEVKMNGKPLTRIQEFKATGSKGHFEAANQAISTPVSQTAGTNSPGLVAPGAGSITITEAGVYAIDFHVVWNAGMTGRSFVEISDGTNAYARNTIAVEEDQTLAALSGKLFTVGQRIIFRVLQSSGATRNYTATIRVTKQP